MVWVGVTNRVSRVSVRVRRRGRVRVRVRWVGVTNRVTRRAAFGCSTVTASIGLQLPSWPLLHNHDPSCITLDRVTATILAPPA